MARYALNSAQRAVNLNISYNLTTTAIWNVFVPGAEAHKRLIPVHCDPYAANLLRIQTSLISGKNKLKTLFTAIVIFWLSSWVPTGQGITIPLVLATLTLLVQLGTARVQHRLWPERLLNICSVFLVLTMVPFGLLGFYFSIDAAVEISLFWLLGSFSYVRLVVGILRAQRGETSRAVVYAGVLTSLAVWSWFSAFALYAHRGVDLEGRFSCILKPVGDKYSEGFNSVWDMRLPVFASFMHSEHDNFYLFHAVMFVPGHVPEHYNWSKRHLRFEPIDPADQDAFLPRICL